MGLDNFRNDLRAIVDEHVAAAQKVNLIWDANIESVFDKHVALKADHKTARAVADIAVQEMERMQDLLASIQE